MLKIKILEYIAYLLIVLYISHITLNNQLPIIGGILSILYISIIFLYYSFLNKTKTYKTTPKWIKITFEILTYLILVLFFSLSMVWPSDVLKYSFYNIMITIFFLYHTEFKRTFLKLSLVPIFLATIIYIIIYSCDEDKRACKHQNIFLSYIHSSNGWIKHKNDSEDVLND